MRKFAVTLGLVLVVFAPIAGQRPSVAGVWRMERYEGGGSVGPATGQLTLVDGRFSLIYAMTGPEGAPSGRAHAGRYRVDGNALALDVEWSMEHVKGKGSVASNPSTRKPSFELKGNTLVLKFENGAVQQFARIAGK